LVPRDDLARRIAACDVVVCHGGPGAIWDALDARKPTVVVPRMRVHEEHVDDHQVAFVRHLGRQGWVIVVEDIDELGPAIERAARTGAGPEIASQAAAAVARIGHHLDALAAGRATER
jgi:UDP-N-acetylglucosamine transferase subunit ALG13